MANLIDYFLRKTTRRSDCWCLPNELQAISSTAARPFVLCVVSFAVRFLILSGPRTAFLPFFDGLHGQRTSHISKHGGHSRQNDVNPPVHSGRRRRMGRRPPLRGVRRPVREGRPRRPRGGPRRGPARRLPRRPHPGEDEGVGTRPRAGVRRVVRGGDPLGVRAGRPFRRRRDRAAGGPGDEPQGRTVPGPREGASQAGGRVPRAGGAPGRRRR